MKLKRGGARKHAPAMAEEETDLKALIHGHSEFFDRLVEMIPARFYLPSAEDKPWFQGLSKAAKASAKKESRENVKKARRARLDPSAPTPSTLELLKHQPDTNPKPSSDDDEEEEDEDGDGDGGNNAEAVSVDRSVTYEELRQRLHRRIEELRGNRNARKDKDDEKPNKSNKKSREKGREADEGKRKLDESSKDEKPESKKKAKLENGGHGSLNVSNDLSFGAVKIDDKKRKRRKLSKVQELEKAKQLEAAKKDPENGQMVAKKHSWKAAESRAAGVKVHDDPKLLNESIKKEKRRHQKHAEKWKERLESVDKTRGEKHKIRADNIKERINQKKMRRIEKREKKLMRPGFEGRKGGYINE